MPSSAERGLETGWRSRVFGSKEQIPVVTTKWRGTLPFGLCTVIDVAGNRHEVEIQFHTEDGFAARVDGQSIAI